MHTSAQASLRNCFHFDVSKDCPEIHPPMFCSKCQLRKIAAQKEKRTYKCLLKPYDWFRWVQSMDRSSNCHISFYHVHSKVVCLSIRIDGPNTGHILETVLHAEIVEPLPPIIKIVPPPSPPPPPPPIQPAAKSTQTLSLMSWNALSVWVCSPRDRLVCAT